MSPENAFTVALERLQTHGRVPHSHLLHIADFDEELMRVVSDRLIRAGLAVDNYGIELVLVDPLGASTGVQEAEAPVATARQGATGAASDAPHTPSRTTGADRRNTSSSLDGKSTGLPRYMFWDAGCETGPFPREELEQRLVEGRLQPNEFVRIESNDEWIPAALALNWTDRPPARHPERKRSAQAPLEDVIAATKLAASIAEAAKRPASSKPNSQPVAEISPLSANAGWMTPNVVRGRLQTGVTISVIVFCLWVYWHWPPASKSIATEFHEYVMQLQGMKDPESPAWKAFVARRRPRIQKLVDSLKSRATGANPVDQNLYWAGETGLLPMLDEGMDGPAERKFNIHWTIALLHLEGTASNKQVNADPRAHAASSTSTLAETAIPPGTPLNAAHAPPGARPAIRTVPPRVKKPTR